jgi:dTDP-4-dehydrorhamnose reductase
MLNILVTGSKGQLGKEIQKQSKGLSNYCFYFTDVAELDITSYAEIEAYAEKHIHIIINAAAYTAVDKAEEDEENAFAVNKIAVENLCRIAKVKKASLIHISTDYVFDGSKKTAYKPEDAVKPNSVYGFSKLAGEEAVKSSEINYAIVRTSWLYSAHGHNFVKTILKYAKERGELKVVYDQIGNPCFAGDLAKAVLDIIPYISQKEIKKIYHYSNEGNCSWYDFAKAIVEIAEIPCEIEAVPSSEYQTAATRPAYSVMDKTRVKKDFNIKIPQWKDSLVKCIQEIKQQ